MSDQRKLLSIGVFVIIEQFKWEYLPKTSEYLTRLQAIPLAGDWLSTHQPDWPLLGLVSEEEKFRSVLIVDYRIFSYGFYDVGVICRFQDQITTKTE